MSRVSAGDHRRRSLRRLARRQQAFRDLLQMAQAHEEHQRSLQSRQVGGSLRQSADRCVAGNDMQTPADAPVCHRDTGCGGNGDGGGDTRYLLV